MPTADFRPSQQEEHNFKFPSSMSSTNILPHLHSTRIGRKTVHDRGLNEERTSPGSQPYPFYLLSTFGDSQFELHAFV